MESSELMLEIMNKYKIKKGFNYIPLTSPHMQGISDQLNEISLIAGVYMEIESSFHTEDIKEIIVKVIYD